MPHLGIGTTMLLLTTGAAGTTTPGMVTPTTVLGDGRGDIATMAGTVATGVATMEATGPTTIVIITVADGITPIEADTQDATIIRQHVQDEAVEVLAM